jgi:hypothetical protein
LVTALQHQSGVRRQTREEEWLLVPAVIAATNHRMNKHCFRRCFAARKQARTNPRSRQTMRAPEGQAAH